MDESTNDAMPIYVGIDGSVPALEAARWAGEYAARIRRSVVLVHSLPDVTWYLGTGVLAGEQEILGELREVGRQALDAAERAVREVNPSIDLRAVQTRKSRHRLLRIGIGRCARHRGRLPSVVCADRSRPRGRGDSRVQLGRVPRAGVARTLG